MKIFTAKDAQEFLRTGAKEFRHDRGTQVTPGARDAFSEAGVRVIFLRPGAAGAPSVAPATTKGSSTTGGGSYEAQFNSPEAQSLKEQICDIGRRLWAREYVDGNGGNISARLGENFICTPTGVSKGFLKPEMLCLVDIEGKQLAGTWKRTSEITTHLAIYRTTPGAVSVCHAHPVHATAFAIAGLEPPGALIPELEVFVGRVPLAPYRTPGSAAMAEVIGPLAPKHQSILMGNHGVICWGTSVEDAYFKMEITDAYCRTLVVGSHLPTKGTSIPCDEIGKLLDMKKGLGLPDDRFGLTPGDACELDPWSKITDRPCACASPAIAPGTDLSAAAGLAQMTPAQIEALVQKITDQIAAKMQ